MPAWILAIDFGTSYTVAASKIGDRSPEVIEVGGERRMPSVVMVDRSGTVVVGRTADDLSATHPGSTLRALKNRLGDQAPVVLDGRPYQVVNLVAALLRDVYVESVRQIGEPPAEVRLTHPATWNRPRLNRLLEAAAKAELPNTALVPEPVAAALSFASEVGVAAGAHVVVYDLGGGTFDTAVVTSSGGGFNIVGRPSGDQNIGGELFDEIIANHLGEQLPAHAWEAIQIGEDPLWRQVGATLRNEARKAKETLSGNPYADLIVPLPTGLQQIRLTREEFEEMVQPYLAETVVLLDRCVHEAGLDSGDLAGISLVGGSSRSPIVERLVKQAFPDVAVIRRGDPKTAVASGAARAVRSSVVVAPVSRGSTQEAAPGTAPQSLRLAPPVSQPPSVGASASGTLAGGGQPSYPPASLVPAPPAPVGSFPPAASFPPSGSFPPAGSFPPVAPAQPLGPGSGLTPGETVTGETVKGEKHKVAWLIGLLVAIVLIGAAVALFVTRSSTANATQPTRKALQSAIVSIRMVRSTLGNEYNEEDVTGSGDPFCPQFALAEPLREAQRLFTASTGSGDTFTSAGFYESISSFDGAASAGKFFEQDRAIVENCKTATGKIGTTPVTYTITDAKRKAASIGRDVIAVEYEASATDGTGKVLLTGLIVEGQIGSIVVSSNFYVSYRDLKQSDTDNFIELTKAAFDRADSQL